MTAHPRRSPYAAAVPGEPFASAEEAWFWFMQCLRARHDGARFVAGAGLVPRPCDPDDIWRALDRLHRRRRLQRSHLLVLRHFGERLMVPDPDRRTEADAARLWDEALDRLGTVLRAKGIVATAGHA